MVLPIPTTAGDPLLVHEQRVVEVEPFLPGSGAAESWPAYEAAFAVLGQLHGVLAAYARPYALPPPRVEHYGPPMTLLDWVARTRRRIQQARAGAGDAAVRVCDDATQILTCLHRWWNERGRYLPRHLVHGDYGVGNLVWAHKRIAAVGDFDFLAVHERVCDLAYAAFWMFERLEATRASANRSWPMLSSMIASYTATHRQPLTLHERRAIPLEMARVPVYWIAEAAFLDDPVDAVMSRAASVAAARWILDNASDLGGLTYVFTSLGARLRCPTMRPACRETRSR